MSSGSMIVRPPASFARLNAASTATTRHSLGRPDRRDRPPVAGSVVRHGATGEIEFVAALAAGRFDDDESCRAQHFPMLRDGGLRHMKRLGELRNGFLRAPQKLEYRSARRIRDGAIDVGGRFDHRRSSAERSHLARFAAASYVETRNCISASSGGLFLRTAS